MGRWPVTREGVIVWLVPSASVRRRRENPPSTGMPCGNWLFDNSATFALASRRLGIRRLAQMAELKRDDYVVAAMIFAAPPPLDDELAAEVQAR